MDNFKLSYRPLLRAEKVILFGKAAGDSIRAIKLLDIENFISLFDVIYNGDEVVLPEFSEFETASVYAYCDIPVNALIRERENTYGIPIHYTKYLANTFLMPFVNKAISPILTKPIEECCASHMYSAVGIHYDSLFDTILGNMFINTYKGRIISISSFAVFRNQVYATNNFSIRTNSLLGESVKNLNEIYSYRTFAVPTSVVEDTLGKVPKIPGDLTAKPEAFLQLKKTLCGYFTETNSSQHNNIVIGKQFLQLCGFTYFNDSIFTAIDSYGPKPFSINGNPTFSNQIDELMSNLQLATDKKILPIRVLQSLGSVYSFVGPHSPTKSCGQAFVFLNSANLATSSLMRDCGLSELIEITPEFIDELRDAYADIVASSDFDTRLKNRKTEFAHKKEAIVDELEVLNNRYMPIRNKDKKLLILTKTSLAKEAARKTAITRKISNAVSPVIDMAIRLFAIRDFATAVADKRLLFPFSSTMVYNIQSSETGTAFLDRTKLLPHFNAHTAAAYALFVKNKTTIASGVIKALYSDITYAGTPFWEAFTVPGAAHYRYSFNNLGSDQQKANVFSCLAGVFMNTFNQFLCASAKSYSDYFSSSSGNLDMVRLAETLYKNARNATFVSGFEYLKNIRYPDNLTGKQMHYFYNNNFVVADQAQFDEIEKAKNQDFIYLANRAIPAISAFTFGQDALDSFGLLKKSSTFTEYGAWFKTVKEALEKINKDTFEIIDYPIYKANEFLLQSYDLLFDELASQETPFIPKEEPTKKRGRRAAALAILLEPNPPEETPVTEVTTGETNGTTTPALVSNQQS